MRRHFREILIIVLPLNPVCELLIKCAVLDILDPVHAVKFPACKIEPVLPQGIPINVPAHNRFKELVETQFQPGDAEKFPRAVVHRVATVHMQFPVLSGIWFRPDDLPASAEVSEFSPALPECFRRGIFIGPRITVIDLVRPAHEEPQDRTAAAEQFVGRRTVFVHVMAAQVVAEDLPADVDVLLRAGEFLLRVTGCLRLDPDHVVEVDRMRIKFRNGHPRR